MLCKRCGHESEGRYCSHCGAALTEAEPGRERLQKSDREPAQETSQNLSRDRDFQYGRASAHGRSRRRREEEEREPLKKAKKQKKSKKKGGFSLPHLPSLKFLRKLDKPCSRAMQLLCAGLMLWMAWLPARALLAGREGLGAVGLLITERNYSLAAYLGGAGVYLAFTCLSALWILTKRHFAGKDRVISADMGRGLTAFALLLLISFSAPWLEAAAAVRPELLAGPKRLLEILGPLAPEIFRLSSLGFLLSLIRRFLKV